MWRVLAIKSSRSLPSRPCALPLAFLSRFFFSMPANGEQGDGDGGGIRPTMIGGAQSTKSPCDQAYIYFACFEGRAAGGCREIGRDGERTGKRTGGRKGGRAGGRKDRGPRNNAAYGACSSRATARDAVQLPAASHHRFSHEAARIELPGCCSPLLPISPSNPVLSCDRSTSPKNPPLCSPFLCYVLQVLSPVSSTFLFYVSRFVVRITGCEFSGIELGATWKPNFRFAFDLDRTHFASRRNLDPIFEVISQSLRTSRDREVTIYSLSFPFPRSSILLASAFFYSLFANANSFSCYCAPNSTFLVHVLRWSWDNIMNLWHLPIH